ncbi:MAG: LOG family protein [Bacteroidales bacterium]|nr:LOG family protein [Bacteroidales bacterium]
MLERKKMLIEQSDMFIALPGGFGTLDESSEVITWNQLKLMAKPFGFLNVDGFFNHLLGFIERGVADRLIRKEHYDSIAVDEDPQKLLQKLDTSEGVAMDKWIQDIKSEKRL